MSANICIPLNIMQVIDPETGGMVFSLRYQRTGSSPFACGIKVYDHYTGLLRVLASTPQATRLAKEESFPYLAFDVFESGGCDLGP